MGLASRMDLWVFNFCIDMARREDVYPILLVYRLGWTSMIRLDNWGWWLEFTPAFYGAGMLSGMNASWSFLGGSVRPLFRTCSQKADTVSG